MFDCGQFLLLFCQSILTDIISTEFFIHLKVNTFHQVSIKNIPFEDREQTYTQSSLLIYNNYWHKKNFIHLDSIAADLVHVKLFIYEIKET